MRFINNNVVEGVYAVLFTMIAHGLECGKEKSNSMHGFVIAGKHAVAILFAEDLLEFFLGLQKDTLLMT